MHSDRFASGFEYELREVDREELELHILDANRDAKVDGIIVYYPIFGNRQDQYLQQIVDVDKDVEGLSHRYLFNMYQNIRFLDEARQKKSLLPCTPLAVIKILEHLQVYNSLLNYGNRLHGRTITVINRSEVVGRPLAALLANDGASVYSVDINDVQLFHRGPGLKQQRHAVVEKPGWSLETCLPLSDVVISGVPGDGFKVPIHLLREGACCINFSSQKNFDPAVKEMASLYVPAIGSVTIAILLRNLLRITRNRQDAGESGALARSPVFREANSQQAEVETQTSRAESVSGASKTEHASSQTVEPVAQTSNGSSNGVQAKTED